MMDKTEMLFRMMEHPEEYDEGQWREILADEHCRALYSMMSATRSAVDAQRYDQQADGRAIQQEWERLLAEHPHAITPSRSPWRRVAAAVAIILVFAGIIVAAVQTRGFGLLREEHPGRHDAGHAAVTIGGRSSEDVADAQEEVLSSQDEGQLYDNVPLEQILDDMAARYNVQVEWHGDDVRSLRLYYRWEPSYTLDKVVDMLGSFESFTIQHTGDRLIVTQTTTQGQ